MALGAVVEVRGVCKKFHEKTVLDGVQFYVKPQESFGLVGVRGAGKSTLLRILAALIGPTEGEVFVFGLNVKTQPQEVKRRLGVVLQGDTLDPDFSVLDNLLIFSTYYQISVGKAHERVRELMRFLQFEDAANQSPSRLDTFDLRKVLLARALLNQPQLILLDEPTLGLTQQQREWFWDRLIEIQQRGGAFILSTNRIEEVQKLCQSVGFLDRGQLVARGEPKDLIEKTVGHEVMEISCDPQDTSYLVRRFKDVADYQILPGQLRLFFKSGQVVQELMSQISSREVSLRPANLEDVYLKITGRLLKGDLQV